MQAYTYDWQGRVFNNVAFWSIGGIAAGTFHSALTNRPKLFTAGLYGFYNLAVSSAFFSIREVLFWKELDRAEVDNQFSAPIYTTVVSAALTGPFVAAITGGFKEQRLPAAVVAAVGIATATHLSYIAAHKVAMQAGVLYRKYEDVSAIPTVVRRQDIVWEPKILSGTAQEHKALVTTTTEHKWWHKLVPAKVLTEDEKNELLQFQLESLQAREKVDELTYQLAERVSLRKLYEEELQRVRAEQNTSAIQLLKA